MIKFNMTAQRSFILSFVIIVGFLVVSMFIMAAYRAQEQRAQCSNFRTQEQAQNYFVQEKAKYLDRDGDEIACENL